MSFAEVGAGLGSIGGGESGQKMERGQAYEREEGLWPIAPQPLWMIAGAGNGIRTRDPNLGKVVLYQLSYSRNRSSTYQSSL